ncbi:MAG: CAP domain-containing protein [Acidobacteria bacterium]|nr:CAP domain-containing protein [Acidobacteriota bacterium]
MRTSLQDAGLAEIADLLADMTNELRKERGIAPLETHPGLSEAARRHSAEMARYGYLDDRTLDGATLRERVPTDFRMSVVAENLFGDARPELDSLTSAKRIFEGWMASDEDRANIEATEAAYFGVAVAVAGDELRAVQIVASAP